MFGLGPTVRWVFTAIVGGKSAGLAVGVTLASVLWVTVSAPGLTLLSSASDPSNERIAISLQSALLGIDDRVDRATPEANLAAARALGLTPVDLRKLTARRVHSLTSPNLAGLTPLVVSLRQLAPPAEPVDLPPVTPASPSVPSLAPPAPSSSPSPSPAPSLLAPRAEPAPTSSPSSAPSAIVPAPVAPRPAAPGAQPAAIDPPAIAAHADVLAEATGRGGATVDYGLPTAHNTAGHDVPVACSPAPAGIFPIGSTRIACSARDSGGFASLSFTVLVRDTTPPALQLPPSLSADATSPDGAVVTFSATATDLVDGAVSASCTPASGSLFPVASTQAFCSARDAAGNTASSSFIVSVNGGDFSAPTILGHTDELAEATGPGGATVNYNLPAANDDADGTVPVSCTPAPGSLFPLGSTQVACNSQDAAGNVATLSFSVTVRDTTAPALQLPPGVSAPATSASGAVVSFSATATDLVDGTVSAACLPASGSLFPVGSTQVTCSAQDVAGNLTNSSFTIAVGNAPDTTPPTIAAHADTFAEATGPSGATVNYTPPTGSDAFDGSVSVTCLPASGSVFSLGSTQVDCSAHDAAGNTASSSYSVIVRDTTPPTIAAHADLTAQASGAGGATVTYTAPTANDSLDGPVTVSCLPASGSLFALGSTTVTCSTDDAAGNGASSSFTVLVRDTTTPTIDAHADVIAEATGATGATVSYSAPTGTDNLDGSVAVSCLPASGSLFALGSTAVNCSAQDAAGNTAASSFAIMVRDTTSPTSDAHADVVAEATGATGAAVSYSAPSATDAVDGSLTTDCLPASGSLFGLGSTQVTCSAQDAAGNVSSSSFAVVVQDTTAPDLQVPAAMSVAPTGPGGAVVTFSATASDLVDGSVSVSCLPVSGSQFPLGTTDVTCSATDVAGNTASSAFTIFVGNGAPPPDTTPPTIAAHANLTVEATAANGATVSYTAPTATDAVDGSVAVSCLPASGSLFTLGTTTVNCSAHDSAGNSASSSFTILVRDTTAPTIAAHANLTVEATAANGATVAYTTPTASDAVGGSVAVSCLPASGGLFALGTTTVNCTSHDAAGNNASSSFTVLVRDTTAPTIAAHANLTVEAAAANGATVSYTTPTASDAVNGSVSVSCLPASGGLFALGTTTVNCSAHDSAGNNASSSFTILVRDTTPPTIAAHANLTIEATAANGATVTYTPPSASDAVNGSISVSCLPASGSTFPIGHTTVTCHAHDAAGNQAATQSFDVLVKSAVAQLSDLNGTITAMHLDPGFSNQITWLVNFASQQVSTGHAGMADIALNALLWQVLHEAASKNPRLTPAQGAQIAAAANSVRTLLGTIPPGSGIPAAEGFLFGLISTINGFGLSNATEKGLLTNAGDSLVLGNISAACSSLASMITTGNAQLTQAQLNVFLPAVNAVRQPLGC